MNWKQKAITAVNQILYIRLKQLLGCENDVTFLVRHMEYMMEIHLK